MDFNQLKQQSESSSIDIHSYSKRKPAQHKEEDDSFIIPIRKNINSSKISDSNVNSTYLSSRFLNINKEAKRLINDSKYKTNFKTHKRAPMALYNQALVFLRFKDKEAAKMSLQKLVNDYPNSDYKEKAQKKLKDIR